MWKEQALDYRLSFYKQDSEFFLKEKYFFSVFSIHVAIERVYLCPTCSYYHLYITTTLIHFFAFLGVMSDIKCM